MANTIVINYVVDGPDEVVAHVKIASDGATGDMTDQVVVDVSALNNYAKTGAAPTKLRIMRLAGVTNGCSAILEFDASTDDFLTVLPTTNAFDYDWWDVGGLIDPHGSGHTGDIVLTSSGLDTAGDGITMVIEALKVA